MYFNEVIHTIIVVTKQNLHAYAQSHNVQGVVGDIV